jgi:4-carboxymuconolactone decarboxylase
MLPRPVYQFIVLSIARATGAAFEWHDHVRHALAAGLSRNVVDSIGAGQADVLPHPYALLHAILAKTMAWQTVPDDLQARCDQSGFRHQGAGGLKIRTMPTTQLP